MPETPQEAARAAWNAAIRVVQDERPYGIAEHHIRSLVFALEAARDRALKRRKKTTGPASGTRRGGSGRDE